MKITFSVIWTLIIEVYVLVQNRKWLEERWRKPSVISSVSHPACICLACVTWRSCRLLCRGVHLYSSDVVVPRCCCNKMFSPAASFNLPARFWPGLAWLTFLQGGGDGGAAATFHQSSSTFQMSESEAEWEMERPPPKCQRNQLLDQTAAAAAATATTGWMTTMCRNAHCGCRHGCIVRTGSQTGNMTA